MHPGIVPIRMTLQRTHHELIPERPRYPRKPWNAQRLSPVDAERVDILRIVGIGIRPALPRSHPRIALAKRNIVPDHVRGKITLHQPHVGSRSDRPQRNRGLLRIGRNRNDIQFRKLIEQRLRISRSRRRILKLAARIQRENAGRGIPAHTRVAIETTLIRPPIIIRDRLTDVIAVAQRCTGDAPSHIVRRLDPYLPSIPKARTLRVDIQLMPKFVVEFLCLIRRGIGRRIFHPRVRIFQHVNHACPRPRPQSQKGVVQISQRIQPRQRRIHPTIQRNIRRSQLCNSAWSHRSHWPGSRSAPSSRRSPSPTRSLSQHRRNTQG